MFKKILRWSCAFSMVVLCGFSGFDSERKAKAARCYGTIKIVRSFADYDVQIVDSFADLHVKLVSSGATGPGLWRIAEDDDIPDYTVKYVDSFGDFSVKFVDSFPGVQ
ncbi:MAG: hypothetical protein IJX22_05700 [Opitutales bacterium]|nr:hypothetical protein [Opitutales bacterium]